MSGGAKGGIAGGVVGGLALLGAGLFLYWRRRKARSVKDEPVQEDLLRHELHHDDVKPHLTEGKQILELSSMAKPAEMGHPPVELEAREYRDVRDERL